MVDLLSAAAAAYDDDDNRVVIKSKHCLMCHMYFYFMNVVHNCTCHTDKFVTLEAMLRQIVGGLQPQFADKEDILQHRRPTC